MADCVWRSNTVVQGVTSVALVSIEAEPAREKLSLDIRSGIPVEPADIPSRFQLKTGRAREVLPDFFYLDYFFLTEKTADVFRRHDLGKGYLHPVEALKKSGGLFGPTYILVPGNQKAAFVPEESKNVKEPFPERYSFATVPKDDDIAMSSAALEGPDVWCQRGVPGLYLSKALGDDLKASGVSRHFHLKRVRIV